MDHGKAGSGGDIVRRLARKGNAKAKALLKVTDAPAEFAHYMVWYRELRQQTLRGFHFEPVQYTEIEAYGRLHRLEISSFDIDMLIMLDGIWRKAQPKPDEKPEDEPRRQQKGDRHTPVAEQRRR